MLNPKNDTFPANSKQLKINFILPRPSLAGGVKSNKLIAEALVSRGHQVRILYVSAPVPMPKIWRIRTYIKRVLYDIKYKKKPHHLEKSTAKLIPINSDPILPIDVPDADVTIATWWETAKWLSTWPESKGLKAHFIRHHELFGGDPEEVKAIYRLPIFKMVISNWLRRILAEEYNYKNTLLVHNGVDRKQFNSTPRSKAKVPTVGFMYSPHPLKDIETTLAAIRKVQKQIPNLKVISFGGRVLNKNYIFPSNFEFHLAPPQALIPELYRSADCWIGSSILEGFYMPGIEAAACHCPIVSTRCGGPEDYIEDGKSGYLVDVGDSDKMAECIEKILKLDDDNWRKMSEASYQISLNFDWDKSAEILEKALLEKLNKRKN